MAHDAFGPTPWRDAVRSAEGVAAALLGGRRSLEGERVAILVSPGSSFVACFFGVLRAGGTAMVLSPLHPAPETAYFCDDAQVQTIVVSRHLAQRVAALDRRRLLAEELVAHPRSSIRATPEQDDPALLVYTSGTTSEPKGALLTHANLSVQQELLATAWGLGESDVLLHALPLHHVHGLCIALLSALGAGAGVRLLDFSCSPFDARLLWESLADATVFMAVPTIHSKLIGAFEGADAATRARWNRHACGLRLVTSGSAALPVSLGERWRDLTGTFPLERFGMTEIGVALSNPLDPRSRRPGTVGLPLPTVRTRIVGDDGLDAEEGELWIAGPSVFAGYHERCEATRAAFVVEAGARWFKTGDTVSRGTDGYIRILGRTNVDIIKSGGYKLSALEIEEAIRECPAVEEVAVVGVPNSEWGERVVACIVAREGRETECATEPLRAFLKQRIAPYKAPRQVVLMNDLPRNALGKVTKPELVKKLGRYCLPG
jgi:malonyl-CoA/methylmalonyl-CoA synthetase